MTIPRSITRLTLEERETYLRINDMPHATWELWTLSPAWADKLRKMGLELQADHQGGWKVMLDRSQVLIRNRPVRWSPAQLDALAKARLKSPIRGASRESENEKQKAGTE